MENGYQIHTGTDRCVTHILRINPWRTVKVFNLCTKSFPFWITFSFSLFEKLSKTRKSEPKNAECVSLLLI